MPNFFKVSNSPFTHRLELSPFWKGEALSQCEEYHEHFRKCADELARRFFPMIGLEPKLDFFENFTRIYVARNEEEYDLLISSESWLTQRELALVNQNVKASGTEPSPDEVEGSRPRSKGRSKSRGLGSLGNRTPAVVNSFENRKQKIANSKRAQQKALLEPQTCLVIFQCSFSKLCLLVAPMVRGKVIGRNNVLLAQTIETSAVQEVRFQVTIGSWKPKAELLKGSALPLNYYYYRNVQQEQQDLYHSVFAKGFLGRTKEFIFTVSEPSEESSFAEHYLLFNLLNGWEQGPHVLSHNEDFQNLYFMNGSIHVSFDQLTLRSPSLKGLWPIIISTQREKYPGFQELQGIVNTSPDGTVRIYVV